jgi:hypothetical protein
MQGPDFLRGGEELWPAGPDVPEKEQDLELRKMFIVNATVTIDAAVDDDVTTSSSLVEYAEKKGYVRREKAPSKIKLKTLETRKIRLVYVKLRKNYKSLQWLIIRSFEENIFDCCNHYFTT